VLDEMPRTATGKVDRTGLKRMAESTLHAPGAAWPSSGSLPLERARRIAEPSISRAGWRRLSVYLASSRPRSTG